MANRDDLYPAGDSNNPGDLEKLAHRLLAVSMDLNRISHRHDALERICGEAVKVLREVVAAPGLTPEQREAAAAVMDKMFTLQKHWASDGGRK